MSRKRNFYFQHKYFISGIRYNVLLEDPENMGKPSSVLTKEFGIDYNIGWRFNKLGNENEKGNLALDLSRVNVAKTNTEENWMDVDSKIVDVIKDMIKENLSDEEISSQIYSRIVESGVNMENKKITKNLSVDIGNNNEKVAIDDKVFSFVNKVRKERQPNKLADNDYIQLSDEQGYNIIANDNDVFEESSSKKEKILYLHYIMEFVEVYLHLK
ncbi:hypothetical protein CcarbDRAFT_1940 [Clostridium carboxidivorans P7]|uniref:Uncharacterized protein n=1 Tax=Clostridium carboxidivorans P7 TaxID=536227 RepID=C6PT23_9CLOT|nr:hypothetical protein [Clostridium carboxidivorans]EET87658.1 hypothetical protein CcarbDRAFT_1940 [Clostridium carboxidivorans P7]